MVGPPGTGKTLLARAIAGEAGVPFFSISGSDFVEMFVGVGASRVRDMFAEGKRHAPCILFIDELDAIGRSRFSGLGGGHDEREQTLNALLVELDGFEANTGIIVMAATNRPDVLDPALLRPGRFDRQVSVDLPDVTGRLGILKVHAKNVSMSENADLQRIARATPGYSGADLANLINEAALQAAREGKDAVETPHLEEARDKVWWGKEKRSRELDERDRRIGAYHEAGHTLVGLLCKHAHPLHKVTIVPRGNAYLGATMHLPDTDRYTQTYHEMIDQLVVLMGGRVAEELVFGDFTSGASMDIKQATNFAKKMVCEWGMSEAIGPVNYGNREEPIFVGRELSRTQDHSEQTAREIDEEMHRIIEECLRHARKLLSENMQRLRLLGETLLEKETLTADEIYELLDISQAKEDEEQRRRTLLKKLDRRERQQRFNSKQRQTEEDEEQTTDGEATGEKRTDSGGEREQEQTKDAEPEQDDKEPVADADQKADSDEPDQTESQDRAAGKNDEEKDTGKRPDSSSENG